MQGRARTGDEKLDGCMVSCFGAPGLLWKFEKDIAAQKACLEWHLVGGKCKTMFPRRASTVVGRNASAMPRSGYVSESGESVNGIAGLGDRPRRQM
jgi:hypothetical protein